MHFELLNRLLINQSEVVLHYVNHASLAQMRCAKNQPTNVNSRCPERELTTSLEI